MSIFIKDIEIPKEGRITLQIGDDGAVYQVTDFELKAETYKYNAVDVPESQWIPFDEGLPEEKEWVGTKLFGTTISDKILITFDVNGERIVRCMSLQNGSLSMADIQTMDALFKG